MLQTRVKRVMQSDDDIGRMTLEAPVALTAATERFVDQLLTRTMRVMEISQTTVKTIQPQHLCVLRSPFIFIMFICRKLAVQMDPSLRFLLPEFSGVADLKNAPALLQYVDELIPPTSISNEVRILFAIAFLSLMSRLKRSPNPVNQ
jgi:hypothetical protein